MMLKNQKSLLINIAGITLSLFLSFAVWGTSVFLIGNNERELLGNKAVSDNIMLIAGETSRAEPYITAGIFEISALPNHMIRNQLKYLAEGEMIEWEESKSQTMKTDAEKRIEDFIEFLINCGFLNGGEYLHEMKLLGPVEGETARELEQYAFWKGNSANSDYTLSYVINAESGGIWYAEIVSNSGSFGLDGLVPEELLVAYEAFLGYPTARPIYYSEKNAYRVYGNNFVSNAEIDGNRIVMRLLPY